MSVLFQRRLARNIKRSESLKTWVTNWSLLCQSWGKIPITRFAIFNIQYLIFNNYFVRVGERSPQQGWLIITTSIFIKIKISPKRDATKQSECTDVLFSNMKRHKRNMEYKIHMDRNWCHLQIDETNATMSNISTINKDHTCAQGGLVWSARMESTSVI